MFNATVLAHSINEQDVELITYHVSYWRGSHEHILTHRDLSRSSASSRAVPIAKKIAAVKESPYVPFFWGMNQPGMVAEQELPEDKVEEAKAAWMEIHEAVLKGVEKLNALGVHKEIANRPLQTFEYIDVIITASELDNFFNLRLESATQRDTTQIARLMKDAQLASTPQRLKEGEWHLPYILDEEKSLDLEIRRKISVARCARVSYKNHGTNKVDIAKDISSHDKLAVSGHWSAFEHAACAMNSKEFYRNLRGFKHYRAHIDGMDRK